MQIGMGMGVGPGRRIVDTMLPSYAWDPRDISGAIFWLPTAYTGSMWVENSGATPATHPSADGDSVGIVQEPIGGFMVGIASDAARAILNSGTTYANYLRMTTGDSLVVLDSTKALRLFQATRVFTVLFKIKFDGDAGGTANAIIDTQNGTSTNNGIYIRRNTNGTLLIQVSGGGINLCSYSTTTPLLGGVEYAVRIWSETSGTAQIHCRVDGGTDEPANYAAAASDTDLTSNLTIGNRTGGSTPMSAGIADLVFTNTADVSDADYALWAAFNPPRTSSPSALQRITAAGNSLTVAQASHLYLDYDFSDVATMWKLSDKSTGNVSAAADKIGFIENTKAIPSGCGSFSRHALNATEAQCPAYATNVTNSLGAAVFAGNTTDTSTHAGEHALNLQGTLPRGGTTHFIVYKNTTTDPGSHLLWVSNPVYLAVGGAAYSVTNRRDLAVVHPTGGTALVSATNPNGGDGFGIIAIRQEGAVAKIWMCNRFDLSETGTISDWTTWLPAWIGRTGDTNWDLAGNVCQYTKYYTAHSDATIRKIVNGLATKWGISNIPTTLDTVA